jgi:hypothetical protein
MYSRESNTKKKIELIIKLKKKIGLPIGNVWYYTESDANKIIHLLQGYARMM